MQQRNRQPAQPYAQRPWFLVIALGLVIAAASTGAPGESLAAWSSTPPTRIVFDTFSNSGSAIMLMRPDGRDARVLFRYQSGEHHNPMLSPDGTRVAFTHQPPGEDIEIFVATTDGELVDQVTHNEAHESTVSWAPGGGGSRSAATARSSP